MDTAAAIALVIFVVVYVLVGPLLLLWSLNTLFALGIAFTFKTWFAAMILGSAVRAASSTKSK